MIGFQIQKALGSNKGTGPSDQNPQSKNANK